MKLSRKLSAGATAALLCLALLLVGVQAAAPVGDNLEIRTYRNTAVSGQLTAQPQDETLQFSLTTPPIKGKVAVEEDGSFVYTPGKNKRGKDYFGYRVTDSQGNQSEEATVIIRIEKQKSAIHYADMDGNGAAYAAVRLAEAGLFTGCSAGGQYVFAPESTVSRGEFLAMCMELSPHEILSGVSRTGFCDDADIPDWEKPYVSTALLYDVVTGYTQDEGAAFSAADPITEAEAVVMLHRALALDCAADYRFDADIVPTWAAQATGDLETLDVIARPTAPMCESLTRADCAKMFLAAMAL